MLYNENYQSGVVVGLEFLVNNAISIETYIDTTMFFLFKYHADFTQYSKTVVYLIFLVDILYLICLGILTYWFVRNIYTKIKLTIRDYLNYFELTDLIEFVIIVLNYLTLAFYFISVINNEKIEIPIGNQTKFQKFVDEADFLFILLITC